MLDTHKYLTLSRLSGGGGGCFPPALCFFIKYLKTAEIRTLKLLYTFLHNSCEHIFQKHWRTVKWQGGGQSNGRVEDSQMAGCRTVKWQGGGQSNGRVEDSQMAGWFLKKSETFLLIKRYRAKIYIFENLSKNGCNNLF